jgi:hypothetical protein
LFRSLDIDQNGGLTADELTRVMQPDQAQGARVTFARHDKDANGELNLDEYLARQSDLERQKSRRAWVKWRDTWGLRLLVGVDVILLLLGARWIFRQTGRRAGRSRVPAATAT